MVRIVESRCPEVSHISMNNAHPPGFRAHTGFMQLHHSLYSVELNIAHKNLVKAALRLKRVHTGIADSGKEYYLIANISSDIDYNGPWSDQRLYMPQQGLFKIFSTFPNECLYSVLEGARDVQRALSIIEPNRLHWFRTQCL